MQNSSKLIKNNNYDNYEDFLKQGSKIMQVTGVQFTT